MKLKELLKEFIEEMLEEQNALAGGNVSATGGLPLTKKPEIFDPERPKNKKQQ